MVTQVNGKPQLITAPAMSCKGSIPIPGNGSGPSRAREKGLCRRSCAGRRALSSPPRATDRPRSVRSARTATVTRPRRTLLGNPLRMSLSCRPFFVPTACCFASRNRRHRLPGCQDGSDHLERTTGGNVWGLPGARRRPTVLPGRRRYDRGGCGRPEFQTLGDELPRRPVQGIACNLRGTYFIRSQGSLFCVRIR